MIVFWAPEAEQDRADIMDYIAADNPSAAIHMDQLFGEAASWLTDHPLMGKPGVGPRSYRPTLDLALV